MDTQTMLNEFLGVYPEFTPLFQALEQVSRFEIINNKLQCVYPEFANLLICANKYPYYMVLAHYLVMIGESKSIGILASSGIKSGSSVGGVSVSFQSTPYGSDNFSYWLALSAYGREYLAWLQRQSGLRFVN
jgi:hypothetical protein